MKIEDGIDEYMTSKSNSLTAKTLRWYTYHLKRFALWCKENDVQDLPLITASHVQRATTDYHTDNSYSKHGYTQVIKGFLNWCAQDEDTGVKERTVRRIEMPKVEQSDIEILSDQEILKLLKTCEKMPLPYRSKALITILLDTGARVSELCYDSARPQEQTGLLLEHVNLIGDSYIWIMGKGRRSRTLGIGEETRKSLKSYLNRERPKHGDYFFLARDGEPLGIRMLEQFITDLGSLSGISPCYPHRFRHTFAVNQLLAGTSDIVLMRLMGHTTLESTKIYMRGLTQLQARQSAPSIIDNLKKKH